MNIRSRLTFLAHLGLILAAVNCSFIEDIPLNIIGPIPIGKIEIDPVGLPGRELGNRPEIKVIQLESEPRNLKGPESIFEVLEEVAHELASPITENSNGQNESRSLKNAKNNFSISMKSLNGGEPHVTGFVSEMKSTTLPNGQTVVEQFEQPIGDAAGDRSLLNNFRMSLLNGFDQNSPLQNINQIPDFFSPRKSVAIQKANHRRRRAAPPVKRISKPSPFVDPLELLLGDAFKKPATRRRPVLRRQRVKFPRIRFIDPLLPTDLLSNPKRFAPLFGENSAPKSDVSFIHHKRLSHRRHSLHKHTVRSPNLVASSGKSNTFQGFFDQLFGAQSSPIQARDIDEGSRKASNPIDELLNSLSGNEKQPVSDDKNREGGDGLLDMLAGLANQSSSENPQIALQKLLTPTNARSKNRITFPEQDEEPDFLTFLKNMGNNNDAPSPKENDPLAGLFGESATAVEKPSLNDLLGGLLPHTTPEPDHIVRLRQRLPKINLKEKFPLMNSFYNSRRIRNGGKKLIFPSLGHRRPPVIAIQIPSVEAVPKTVSVHRQRTHTHAQHHKQRVFVQKTEPASSNDNGFGDLIGQLLLGQGNPDLGRI